MNYQDQPIGVFDSGVGGLTVLKALKQHLPEESFIYLGDTARLPYGTKSAETIQRYTLQTAELLTRRGIKMLVVACNTASSVALERLQQHLPETPVVGVIQPGAQAAVAATKNGHIAVIATESTVRNGAYERAIHAQFPTAVIQSQSCPLLVALAEEGWHDGEVVEAVVARYLKPVLRASDHFKPDCLVLGCTHFPVLREVIQAYVGSDIMLVDSANTTATVVAGLLAEHGLKRVNSSLSTSQFLVTDAPDRFARIASQFLGETLLEKDIHLVDL
ncbi:MAG: glutamate racemase [Legionellales bacterium]|nr:glutamate racemase [Legionellales bacterium]